MFWYYQIFLFFWQFYLIKVCLVIIKFIYLFGSLVYSYIFKFWSRYWHYLLLFVTLSDDGSTKEKTIFNNRFFIFKVINIVIICISHYALFLYFFLVLWPTKLFFYLILKIIVFFKYYKTCLVMHKYFIHGFKL